MPNLFLLLVASALLDRPSLPKWSTLRRNVIDKN